MCIHVDVFTFQIMTIPSTSAVTRITLTSAQKMEIILAVDKSGSQTLSQSAPTYGIHKSTLTKLFKAGTAFFPEVDLAKYKWLQDERSQRKPISGPILKAKAELFDRNFHYNGWTCNDGWLQRWKDRYGISARVLSGVTT